MMKVKPLFWNDSESRLRSGWRILLTWMTMLLIFQLLKLAVDPILPAGWSRGQKLDFYLICFAVIASLVIWKSRILLDERAPVSLGLSTNKGFVQDIVAGFIISAILVLTVLLIEIGNGWLSLELLRLEGTEIAARLFHILFVGGFIAAWWENLFFVSYLFLNLKDGCGFWCAFVLNCLIFGSIHLGNPNANLAAFGGIVLIHAYELYAFLRTRNLWLVFGIHAGWNFLQGLSGFPVSGQAGNEIIAQVNITPAWVGGGLFGPEAGLVVVVTSAIAFALIWFYTKLGRG